MSLFLVGEAGFEPTKAEPTDLQSVPFGHSGTLPKIKWSWWSESNQQPADYKSAALPLSHTSTYRLSNILTSNWFNLVPRGGIEPPTRGFSVLCSTDWATEANKLWRPEGDSNPWPLAWQASVLTSWTTRP